MKVHSFSNSLAVGKKGEAVFSRLLTLSKITGIKDVSNDKEYQPKGIDFLAGKNNVGYDVKYDARAADTGNIAIEISSVIKNGEIIKQGWLYTSQADYIVYLFDEDTDYRLAFFTKTDLERYADMGRSRRVRNKGYESVVSVLSLSKAIPSYEFSFNLENFETDTELQRLFIHIMRDTYSGVKVNASN